MKKSILLLLVMFSFCALSAQEVQTLEQAKQIAQKKNKIILMVFQGSDWCAPCMKLEREIFSSDEFLSYAKEELVMLKLDFPRRKKNALSQKQQNYNNTMAEQFNRNGHFPLVVVLNAKGESISKMGYSKSTSESFIDNLKTLKNKHE